MFRACKRKCSEAANIPAEKLRKSSLESNHEAENSRLEPFRKPQKSHAGVILEMHLRNFMCHSSLRIKLNKNTNFLTGNNGSGKSAILTAVVVGFGGRASTTNRGNSLKGLIKSGESSATVTLTIYNEGVKSYRPEIFGKTITICRTISKSGSYIKIKSESGKVIGSSTKELLDLAHGLRIQIDNPVVMLNQDIARTFLNSNNPADMYKFFFKASQLQSFQDALNVCLKREKISTANYSSKENELKELKKNFEKWEKKFQNLSSMEEYTNKKIDVENELFWSQIRDLRIELKKKEDRHSEIETEYKKLENYFKNKSEELKSTKTAIKKINDELATLNVKNNEQAEKLLDFKRYLQRKKDLTQDKNHTLQTLQKLIEKKALEKKTLEEEIKKLSGEYPEFEAERAKKKAEIASLERKIKDVVSMLTTCETDLKQIESNILRTEKECSAMNDEISIIKRKINEKEMKIRSLQVELNNALSIYGPHMPKLLAAINAVKSEFQKPPIGPLGSYIKLKDKKWALAIEDFISGGMLKAFCVDNHHDSSVLARVFQRILGKERKPQIICSKFFNKVHDVSRNLVQAPNGSFSLMEMLEISEPVVWNCLIDNNAIEGILLVPLHEDAFRMMSSKGSVPPNCKRALTLRGDQYFPSPNLRTYGCKHKRAIYLQVSAADALLEHKTELTNHQANLRAAQQQAATIVAENKEQTKQSLSLRAEIHKLNKSVRSMKYAMEDLTAEIAARADVEALLNELKELEEAIRENRFKENNLTSEIEELDKQTEEIDNKIKMERQCALDIIVAIRDLNEKLRTDQGRLQELESADEKGKRKENVKQELDSCKEDLKNHKIELATKTKAALSLCPEISDLRPIDVIVADYNKIKETIKSINEEIGDPATVVKTYQEYHEKYTKTAKQMESFRLIQIDLHKAMKRQTNIFKLIRQRLTEEVRLMFAALLRVRKYKGSMDINHEDESLKLNIIPNTAQGGSGKTKILSGGERSFSTVAFLLSMWQCMDFPFHFLDEFDVFMDEMNRTAVMQLLLHHSKNHMQSQFVFLTPQSIDNVGDEEHVTFHRMADPARKCLSQPNLSTA